MAENEFTKNKILAEFVRKRILSEIAQQNINKIRHSAIHEVITIDSLQ